MALAEFPHLLPEDCAVWRRFLDRYAEIWDRFEYDVRVGKGRDPGPQTRPHLQRMGIELSQRRIDALGFRDDGISLIEITRLADLKAIGQLVTYPILYKRTFKTILPIVPTLVAERIGTDLIDAYNSLNIEIYLV